MFSKTNFVVFLLEMKIYFFFLNNENPKDEQIFQKQIKNCFLENNFMLNINPFKIKSKEIFSLLKQSHHTGFI